MEQVVETKTKRKYNKYDWSTSKLMSVLVEKQKSIVELSKELNVGQGTTKRYFKSPLNMNGHQRKIVCKYLELTAEELFNIIDK